MTNFDFLTKDKQFETFSGIAVVAEKTLHIDLSTCIINCRRAMEMAGGISAMDRLILAITDLPQMNMVHGCLQTVF